MVATHSSDEKKSDSEHDVSAIQMVIAEQNTISKNEHNTATIELISMDNELESDFILYCETRIITWAKKGQYEKAHEEAKSIVNTVPCDPRGYLIAGRLYADQGFQQQAIDVFDKGLKIVPRTDTLYQELELERQLAEQKMNRFIDFCVDVPYDIGCHIIDRLIKRLSTIVQCSRVSSAWRSFVLNYPKPWRHITADGSSPKISLRPSHILPSIIHHIQHLVISPSKRTSKKCLELILTKNNLNIQSLVVTEPHDFSIEAKQDFYSTLYSSLMHISNTLTVLAVLFSGQEYDKQSPFTRVLSACRNLTTLKFNSEQNNSIASFIPPSPQHISMLTNLVLDTPSEIICNSEGLQNLLKCCPHLYRLVIANCSDDVYQAIQKYGSGLKVLRVGTSLKHYYDNIPDESPTSGLQVLEISDYTAFRKTATGIIEQHHITLRALCLCKRRQSNINATDEPLNRQNWRQLTSHHFPNLTHLYVECATPASYQFLPSILSKTPNLEHLFIRDVNELKMESNIIPSDAFPWIANMNQLSMLRLAGNLKFNPHDLVQLLNSLAQQSSTLSRIHMKSTGSANDDVMVACSRIKSLNSLTFEHAKVENASKKEEFLKNISQHPNIKILFLYKLDLTMEDWKLISKNKIIESVLYTDNENDSDTNRRKKVKEMFSPTVKLFY